METVVIGGGQAGLAVGYHLARQGREFVILDAHPRIGDAWRRRWESLRLFTPARYNGLPGMPFPAAPDYFPTKNEMADYLESYAVRFALPVRTGVRVDRLAKSGERFLVEAGGQRLEADQVVIAMSAWQHPRVPAFATGLDAGIRQLHSIDYREPEQLRDGPVLVVGSGNSGYEIALDAARGHVTMLAGRDTGHIPFRLDGLPARLLLRRLVLGVLFHRVFTVRTPIGRRMQRRFRLRGMPLVRLRPSDLAAAGVARLPRVVGVRQGQPLLDDGRVLDVANVVWCTGFHPGLDWVDLDVFKDGDVDHERGVVTQAPGLYVVGLGFVYAVSSAMVHGVGRDAEYIARRIAMRAPRPPIRRPTRPRIAAVTRGLALAVGVAVSGCSDSTGAAPVGWEGISAGSTAACAIAVTGAAHCWGRGSDGQLGITLTPDSILTPAAVAGGHAFDAVAMGSFHACGVTKSGVGYCWGSNGNGQLGTGDHNAALVPTPVAGGHHFTMIAVEFGASCGLTTTGAAYCWGDDGGGMLGNGALGSDSFPSPVAGGHTFTSVDVGLNRGCGVAVGGAAFCWGDYITIGDGGDTNATAPVPVSGGLQFLEVRVGNLSACGRTTDRRLYCWGGVSAPGVLGDGGDTVTNVPVPVASSLRFAAVDVGQTHACAIADGGAAYCWGSNSRGELGIGTTGAPSLTPVPVIGGHRFRAISTGPFSTCAINLAGEAWCWGDNRYGRLGNGTTAASDIPVRVAGVP